MAGVDPEFAVAAPDVLDEGMTENHRRRDPISSQTAHRTEPCLEPSGITFDPAIRVLGRVRKNLSPTSAYDEN